jgi:hypothetical protein
MALPVQGKIHVCYVASCFNPKDIPENAFALVFSDSVELARQDALADGRGCTSIVFANLILGQTLVITDSLGNEFSNLDNPFTSVKYWGTESSGWRYRVVSRSQVEVVVVDTLSEFEAARKASRETEIREAAVEISAARKFHSPIYDGPAFQLLSRHEKLRKAIFWLGHEF